MTEPLFEIVTRTSSFEASYRGYSRDGIQLGDFVCPVQCGQPIKSPLKAGDAMHFFRGDGFVEKIESHFQAGGGCVSVEHVVTVTHYFLMREPLESFA